MARYHRHGGQPQSKRHANLAANRASADVRIEHVKELRSKHLQRLDEALRQGGATLQSMLIMSERLTRIGGSEGVAMSPPQATRIRNQCMAVANYFRALDLYYPKLGLLECAGKAAENSGHASSSWRTEGTSSLMAAATTIMTASSRATRISAANCGTGCGRTFAT